MHSIVHATIVFGFLLTANAAAAGSHVVGEGQFTGASNHVTSGKVTVESTGSGKVVELQSDFSFDGAPDPRVGFGKGGTYDPESDLGALTANAGEQAYQVPASIDPAQYDEVYIWCRKFNVPLGVAKIK